MPVLTAIDLLGIQKFVFGSNRLRDVVGASALVTRACSWEGDSPLRETPEAARLVAAGGNAVRVFAEVRDAQAFAGRYTRWLYDHAPGLDAVVVHRAFEDGDLAVGLGAIQVDLARAKTERAPSATLLGISVTESCHETGLPAVDLDRVGSGDPAPVSRATLAAREAFRRERAREREITRFTRPGLTLPRELDQLGRTRGDTSLLGVVHVDGNRVGANLTKWLRACVEAGLPDDALRAQYVALSRGLDGLAARAMTAVLRRVEAAVQRNEHGDAVIVGTPYELGFELTAPDRDDAEDGGAAEVCAPVRPILVGGDDLTFVCDGRLALDLAETALEVFARGEIPHLPGRVTASAGVAIVRSHAPFYRAYALAEGLCRQAKRMLNDTRRFEDCALDWHLGATRPGEDVASIRERQYRDGDHELTTRPLVLGARDAVGSWRWLDRALLGAREDTSLRGRLWRDRRNKVKALRELVRDGRDEIVRALDAWRIVDRDLALPSAMRDGFLQGRRTPLLDAIELMDVHLSLEPQEGVR
jgi:hypothetical protein